MQLLRAWIKGQAGHGSRQIKPKRREPGIRHRAENPPRRRFEQPFRILQAYRRIGRTQTGWRSVCSDAEAKGFHVGQQRIGRIRRSQRGDGHFNAIGIEALDGADNRITQHNLLTMFEKIELHGDTRTCNLMPLAFLAIPKTRLLKSLFDAAERIHSFTSVDALSVWN
ncbi:MAG: hypothetical protein QM739_16160 [Propionivibrio sp.]